LILKLLLPTLKNQRKLSIQVRENTITHYLEVQGRSNSEKIERINIGIWSKI